MAPIFIRPLKAAKSRRQRQWSKIFAYLHQRWGDWRVVCKELKEQSVINVADGADDDEEELEKV